MAHRAMLNCIHTHELLNPDIKLLDITVDEEHERREIDKNRISLHHQVFKECQVQGTEHDLVLENVEY